MTAGSLYNDAHSGGIGQDPYNRTMDQVVANIQNLCAKTPTATLGSLQDFQVPASAPSNAQDSQASTPVDSSPQVSVSGLQTVGTFSVSSPGEVVTTEVAIGQPVPNTQGQPPTKVLNACNWNYTSTIATAVYLHGQVQLHYTGTLAGTVDIGLPAAVTNLSGSNQFGAGNIGTVCIQGPDGLWHSGNGEDQWSYNFQPNGAATLEWWADLDVLSNAHPILMDADKAALALNWHAYGADQLSSANLTVAGSNAAICIADDGTTTMQLLLYHSPPYVVNAKDVNGGDHLTKCTAP